MMLSNWDIILGNIGTIFSHFSFSKCCIAASKGFSHMHHIYQQQDFILLNHTSHSVEILVFMLQPISELHRTGKLKIESDPDQGRNRIYQISLLMWCLHIRPCVHANIGIQLADWFFQLNFLTYMNGLYYRVIHHIHLCLKMPAD